MLLLNNMPAVAWSSKGTPHTWSHSHSISCTIPTPTLLPDVPPIHRYRPHHHNGYHFTFLINNESLAIPVHAAQNTKCLLQKLSTQPTVSSVTNMTKEGKMYVKGEPKLPNVLVGRFRSFGTRHCVAVWLVPSSSGSSHTQLDPEDEGITIVPNTGHHSPNTMLSHLQQHCC
jgi:hypothetical protein